MLTPSAFGILTASILVPCRLSGGITLRFYVILCSFRPPRGRTIMVLCGKALEERHIWPQQLELKLGMMAAARVKFSPQSYLRIGCL